MKPQGKKIQFKRTPCPGREQLLLYTKDGLAPAEKHLVEAHLVDCELCSDAVEGLEMLTGTAILDKTLQEGRMRYHHAEGSASADTWKLWAAAASVALLIVSAIWFYHFAQIRVTQNLVEAEKVKQQNAGTTKMPRPPAEPQPSVGTFTGSETAKREIKHEPVTVTSKESGASFQKKSRVTASDENSQAVEERNDDANESVKPASAVTENNETKSQDISEARPAPVAAPALNTYRINREANEIRYVEGFKTLAEKENHRLADSLLVTDKLGVEAKYENEKMKKERAVLTEDEIHYESYNQLLDLGIHYFNKKDYKNALDVFNLILGARANDENALFYGAMSHDGLNQSARACANLEKILLNQQSVFYEESKWHLALIRLKEGKKNEAMLLLREIAEGNGFYSQQASSKLAEIK